MSMIKFYSYITIFNRGNVTNDNAYSSNDNGNSNNNNSNNS